MYGNKDEKRKRLEKIAAVVARAPAGVTQAALARVMGVSRATIGDESCRLLRSETTHGASANEAGPH